MGKRQEKLLFRTGVAAVEFALVAPIFFLFVLGLIEFGRMLMVQQSLTNAAREGCRTAVLATTTSGSQVESAVRNYLQPIMHNSANAAEVRVTVPASPGTATSGTNLTVSVETDFADVSWLPFQWLGLNPTIAAQQTGQRE